MPSSKLSKWEHFIKSRYRILFLIIFNILFSQYDTSALENSVKFNVSLDREEYFPGEKWFIIHQ